MHVSPCQELSARVLVVDDDTPARQLVRKYLVSRGAVVFEAENPYFALGRLTDADIDLVITDLNMPGRSGLWLLEEIRTRQPHMPVIVMSADEKSVAAVHELVPGIPVLRKPFALADMGNAIEKTLHGRLISAPSEAIELAPATASQHHLKQPYTSPTLTHVIPGNDADAEHAIPWSRRIHPDDLDDLIAQSENCLQTGEPFRAEYRVFSSRGDLYWVLHEARVANFPNRQRVLSHEAVIDITRHKTEAEIVRASEERHRFLTEYSTDMISVASWEGRFLYASPACINLLGYEAEELIGTTLYDLVHEGDRTQVRRTHLLVLEKMGGALLSYRVRRKDGRYIWFESSIREVPRSGRDTPRELVLVSRDVTERKLQEERLKDLAILDELTGLYNRRGFMALANQHLKQAKRNKRRALVIFADLNGLKTINDTHGHADGDRALIAAADIFNRTFRDSDVVARVGGDEFAILAVEADPHHLDNIRTRLQQALDVVNRRNLHPFELSVSIGVVSYDPDQHASVEELMAMADREMYVHKRGAQLN
jgi:diguanylate cyclase (GGDEF)-like protein/PAS domain S-box-containing protein